MAPIRYIVSLQIFWKKNPFRTFLYVYIEKDFFLVLEIKGVFFKNHTKPWQEMTYIVFTTRNNPSAFIQAYECRQQKAYRKMLWKGCYIQHWTPSKGGYRPILFSAFRRNNKSRKKITRRDKKSESGQNSGFHLSDLTGAKIQI